MIRKKRRDETKMGKIYKAAKGAPFSQKKAQVYGGCIEEIAMKRNGAITPRDTVDVAEDINSPLHDYFDWNDETAGAKYRLYQARQLINHLIVVVETEGGETEQKAYLNVSVVSDGKVEPIYVTIEQALTDKEFRNQILAKAIREVEYWQQKYIKYNELVQIFKAIETTRKDIF